MEHHTTKEHFSFLILSVIALEVMAYILFLVGVTTSLYGFYYEQPTTAVITAGFGGLVAAFFLMAVGEMVQLLMKIEHNTRSLSTIAKKLK